MGVLTIPLLVVGIGLLVLGGEMLVRGGSGIGRAFGLSPMVIGLTIVAFSTSSPELAVTLGSSLSGSPEIAVGTVVGSNIVNILLMLGIAAIIVPIAAKSRLVKVDVPVMIFIAALFVLFAIDGTVSRIDGGILFILLLGYTVWLVRRSRAENNSKPAEPIHGADPAEIAKIEPKLWRDIGLAVVGIAVLLLGARLLVTNASDIAVELGLSELVIGLTVVAIGTSLPELAITTIAALRRQGEMAIGNIVGSTIFNIGAVMGLTGLIVPGGVPVDAAAIRFDLPVMLAVAVALFPIVFTGFTIRRWEGILFVAYYCAYVLFLLLNASDHSALDAYSTAMLLFVVPLTFLTLIVLVAFEVGVHRGKRQARARDG